MAYGSRAVPSVGERILENMAFIAEVFEGYKNDELPNVPFLELARSFELADYRDS